MTDGISQRQGELLRRFSIIFGALLFSSGLFALAIYLWAASRVRGSIEVSDTAAPPRKLPRPSCLLWVLFSPPQGLSPFLPSLSITLPFRMSLRRGNPAWNPLREDSTC